MQVLKLSFDKILQFLFGNAGCIDLYNGQNGCVHAVHAVHTDKVAFQLSDITLVLIGIQTILILVSTENNNWIITCFPHSPSFPR